MEGEKIFCPYCGPWNGHPNGVEMREDGNGITVEKFGYPEQFWYYCPACGAESPCEESRETARAAALRRFVPGRIAEQKPIAENELHTIEQSCIMWAEVRGCRAVPVLYSGWTEGEGFTLGVPDAFDEEVLLSKVKRYGKDWRLWLDKPTQEECEAAKWEDDEREQSRTETKG